VYACRRIRPAVETFSVIWEECVGRSHDVSGVQLGCCARAVLVSLARRRFCVVDGPVGRVHHRHLDKGGLTQLLLSFHTFPAAVLDKEGGGE
jgi:hypothetical protein